MGQYPREPGMKELAQHLEKIQEEKLVLVSLYYRYQRYQAFVKLPVSGDGKVRISEDQLFKLFNLNPDRGETYTPGG